MNASSRAYLLAAALLATAGTASHAQAPVRPEDPDPCTEARERTTQLSLTECAQARYLRADEKLNAAYAALLKELAGHVEHEARLKAAQRAWIAFRDADCALVASQALGGSMEPQLEYECLEAATEARIKDLTAFRSTLAESL